MNPVSHLELCIRKPVLRVRSNGVQTVAAPEWLQWLILCVHLTGLRDAQRAGKTLLFLGESVRVSLKARGTCNSRLSRDDHLHGRASPKPPRAWTEQAGGGRPSSLSLSELSETSLSSYP